MCEHVFCPLGEQSPPEYFVHTREKTFHPPKWKIRAKVCSKLFLHGRNVMKMAHDFRTFLFFLKEFSQEKFHNILAIQAYKLREQIVSLFSDSPDVWVKHQPV